MTGKLQPLQWVQSTQLLSEPKVPQLKHISYLNHTLDPQGPTIQELGPLKFKSLQGLLFGYLGGPGILGRHYCIISGIIFLSKSSHSVPPSVCLPAKLRTAPMQTKKPYWALCNWVRLCTNNDTDNFSFHNPTAPSLWKILIWGLTEYITRTYLKLFGAPGYGFPSKPRPELRAGVRYWLQQQCRPKHLHLHRGLSRL